jgi:spore coat polysaccharide biosynthesis protein SpsF
MQRPVAIIQARMGSTRLPGKVLLPIVGKPMLWHIVQRLRSVPQLVDVVVATTSHPGDQVILDFCHQHGIASFAGEENDVLDRFYQAAVHYQGDPVVRVTGDCPLVDSVIVEKLMKLYGTGRYDHVGVATGAGGLFLKGHQFPDGLDAECFSFESLERAWREATLPVDREHVTPYLWRNKKLFRCGNLISDRDYSHFRWTVDDEADFRLVSRIYETLYQESKPFLMADILNYLQKHPELARINESHIGQEGYLEIWQADPPSKRWENRNR